MPVNVVTEPIHKPSIIATIVVMIVKYWLVIVGLFAIAIIITFIYVLWKSLKHKIDPFKDVYNRTKALCKFHRNPVVRTVYLMSEKKLQYIGNYMGECITQDGYKNIMFWKGKKWYAFWIPARIDFLDLVKEIFIIKCNMNKEYSMREWNDDQKKMVNTNYEISADLVNIDGDKLLIKGLGVERVKYFLYPILQDDKGNVVDKKLEIFDRQKTPALIETMYNQVEDFANVARELINLNPLVRFKHKTGEMPEQK